MGERCRPSSLRVGYAGARARRRPIVRPRNKGGFMPEKVTPRGAHAARPRGATAALVLADGAVLWGRGVGASGRRVGEVCFNTSMTGYQEILTDPSYAGQIITRSEEHT